MDVVRSDYYVGNHRVPSGKVNASPEAHNALPKEFVHAHDVRYAALSRGCLALTAGYKMLFPFNGARRFRGDV
jgi:hypothetical protein